MFHVKQCDGDDSMSLHPDDTPLAQELADVVVRRRRLAQEPWPLPRAPRVFTIANQKGGVGKTTTAVNIAAALSRHGARVLVVDLDPQGNASTALGVGHDATVLGSYEVVLGTASFRDVVRVSSDNPLLYCSPATINLAGAEIELVSMERREYRLADALSALLYGGDHPPFDYVFIDCPPSLGLLTLNAFVAASEVLIPIQCEYYALEGLSQLLGTIERIKNHLNPAVSVSTILLTMFDSRTNLAHQVADDVRQHFPAVTLRTVIPRSVRVSEAPSFGQSVLAYDEGSPGAVSYAEAALEIATRGRS